MALRSAQRSAAPRTGKSGQTAHWRGAPACRRIRRDRAKPLPRIPRLEPRSRGGRPGRAHAPQGPVPWHVRPAGRPAPDHDGRSVQLASRTGRRVSSFRRSLPAPFPGAVLSRLGGRASDHPARPARRRPLPHLYRRDDRHRNTCVSRRQLDLRFRQAALCRIARRAGQERVAPARVSRELSRDARRDRGVCRQLARA